ncbi:hypothetical protein ACHAW5_003405 [Stephanodiscus triporus]|uniref:Uncharacterized protein n=1 Tax=Stephanodiscus triporus TaxID=2934178 RepID=A0ABD3NRZ6_9STRA
MGGGRIDCNKSSIFPPTPKLLQSNSTIAKQRHSILLKLIHHSQLLILLLRLSAIHIYHLEMLLEL